MPETRSRKTQLQREEISLADLRAIYQRRKRIIFLCVVLGGLLGVLLTLLLPRRYESVAKLTVSFAQPANPSVEALAQAAGVADPTKLQTQVEILETDSLAWQVISQLRLDQQKDALPHRFAFGPEYCGTAAGQPITAVSNFCRTMLIGEFHTRLHVQAVPRTEILEIRYRSRSRSLAAEVVNTLAAAYQELTFSNKYQSSMRTSSFLESHLEGVRHDAEEAERRYIEYQRETGQVGLDGAQNLELAQVATLNQHLVNAEAERIVEEARYQVAQSDDPEALLPVTQGTTLQELHAQQIALENQYAQMSSKFGEEYPRVIALKDQIKQAREATQAEIAHTRVKLKTEYDAAKDNEDKLRATFEERRNALYNRNEAAIRLMLLKSDVDAGNELYQMLVKRIRTGVVLAGVNDSDINVIDPGEVPTLKAEPHGTLNLAAGLAGGLFVGVLLSLSFEAVDGQMRTRRDIAQLAPLAGAPMVPLWSAEPGDNALTGSVMLDLPDSDYAEGYRAIRTALLHASATPPKVVLVASPREHEGSDEIALNLAVAYAQSGRNTLLFNAAPGAELIDSFAQTGPHFADALGRDVAAEIATVTSAAHLSVLPHGSRNVPRADALDTPAMQELIARLRNSFDIIVVHAPPVLARADARVLNTMADAALLVVKVAAGRRSDIVRSLEVLDSVGGHVAGAVATIPGTAVGKGRNHVAA